MFINTSRVSQSLSASPSWTDDDGSLLLLAGGVSNKVSAPPAGVETVPAEPGVIAREFLDAAGVAAKEFLDAAGVAARGGAPPKGGVLGDVPPSVGAAKLMVFLRGLPALPVPAVPVPEAVLALAQYRCSKHKTASK